MSRRRGRFFVAAVVRHTRVGRAIIAGEVAEGATITVDASDDAEAKLTVRVGAKQPAAA